MNWETRLIALYLKIDEYYHNELHWLCQRFSNNSIPWFSDVELLTVYLFGLMEKRRQLIDIHTHTCNHLREWFPQLPSYAKFNTRLNFLCSIFPRLSENILAECSDSQVLLHIKLIDSMPIILANAKRSHHAKVAKEFANKGFCASKGIYYYGVKLHVLALRRPGCLPIAENVKLTAASDHDLKVLEFIAPYLSNGQLYADRAYIDELLKTIMNQEQNFQIYTPVKKQKGQQTDLDYFQKLLSTSVSSIRQPIESFFNWIEQKTGIQCASKVRSYKGLITHVFGRLAAALFMLVFNW